MRNSQVRIGVTIPNYPEIDEYDEYLKLMNNYNLSRVEIHWKNHWDSFGNEIMNQWN